MATIKEVAELANVSVPTVYKVFDENYTTTDQKKSIKSVKGVGLQTKKKSENLQGR